MEIPDISVVVIARNEEDSIGHCLASLVRVTEDMRAEILFVDSASTDRTVEVARSYPVRIAGLNPGSPLSPSAGRWVGTGLSGGKYIFYVDGDMIVLDHWLPRAIELLADPALGGVGGRLFWVTPGDPITLEHKDDLPMGRVPGLGGGAVYKRKALDDCGGFNPFLRGEEERELAYRLKRGGYGVMRVDVPMAVHLDKPRSIEENLERSTYFTGVGQIMRRHPLRSGFWDLVIEHREVYVAWFTVAFFSFVTILLAVSGHARLFLLWVASGVLGTALLAALKGPRRFWLYVHARYLLAVCFVQGIRRGLPSPDRFPGGFTWIKKEV